jgi:hypothetical protein
MAARENQGLQIALIIFVILTIILTVTTYLFFSSYQKEVVAKTSAEDARKKAETATAAAVGEFETIKTSIVGAKQTDKLDPDIKKLIEKDVAAFGKGVSGDNQNYHFLTEHLGGELRNANTRVAELTAKNTALADKIKADETAKAAEIAQYKKQLADAAKDLDAERKKFGTDREGITTEKGELAKKFDSKRREHEELAKKSNTQIEELTGEKTKLTTLLKIKNDKVTADQKANEIADGKVNWVNQRSRSVWINRGTADNLRLQTTFAVFAKEETNPIEGNSKGKLQVIRLMEPHLAEARIVEDDLSNPIMPGDLIFSTVWQPGRAEHFALAGFMDIDHDGEDDRERIRDLISLNGGVVDAETTAEGQRTGNISVDTKYLVLGSEPKGEKVAGYSALFDEAKTYGVRTMSPNEFVDYMGYKAEDRTVSLGRKAKSTDFKPRMPPVQRIMPKSDREREFDRKINRTAEELKATPAPDEKNAE